MPDTATVAAPPMIDSLKSWTMVIITLVFVALYALSLAGVKGLFSEAAKELQPIVFVIIGYYFGRQPSQEAENSLKEQVRNQTIRTDAAGEKLKKAEAESRVLEERLKNAKTIIETEMAAGDGADEAKTDSSTLEAAAIKVMRS